MNHCSHQCLIIPNGHRCACPDGHGLGLSTAGKCNAAFEQPLSQPIVCKCKNGGWCQFDDQQNEITCKCPDRFSGALCDQSIAKQRIKSRFLNRLVPMFLFFSLFAIIALFAAYYYVQKKNL